jgi:nicotinamidase-related amidase
MKSREEASMKNSRLVFILTALVFICITPALAGTIVEEWNAATPPPPVELKDVTVSPANTAFLVLDIEERTCNTQARPRCVESAPRIGAFLAKARAAGMPVVHSLTSKGSPDTILPAAKPLPGEPIVQSSVDKFFKTELETILANLGVENVIIVGTTAEGAVLHTATGASMRGLNVIVPVDGMSAGTLYAEQYTAWHLLNAPGTRARTSLTRLDMIDITSK